MSTEPFAPPSDADPAEGIARIAPVTPEMMDHAAHAAAERADAVAHEAPEPVPAATDPVPHAFSEAVREAHHDVPDTEPEPIEPAPEAEVPQTIAAVATAANENAVAASEAVATVASITPRAADLAVAQGRTATGRTIEAAERAAAGLIDNFGHYNAKVIEIAATNMSAAGELVSALLQATSISDAAAINAEHMRRHLDALTTQGRDLMRLAQGVAFDAMRPSGDDPREP